jgi:hypothetical protein
MEHGQQESFATKKESTASAAIETLQREASELTREAKREASHLIEQRLDSAFTLFDDIERAVRAAARELDNEGHPRIAGYVKRAAEEVAHTRKRFRTTDVNELISTTENLARTRPALVLGAAFAAGFAFVRFLKSTAPELRARYEGDARASEYGEDAGYDYDESYRGYEQEDIDGPAEGRKDY